jgi:hypothetical protein
MASRFYWYAPGSARLLTLDVYPAALQADVEAVAEGVSPLSGRAVRVQQGVRWRVTLDLQAVSEDDRYGLRTLVSHLQRGGAVGFARDPDKALLAWTVSAITPGTSSFLTSGGSQMLAWEPSAALASGDRLIVQSQNPEGIIEEPIATSVSSVGLVTLSTPIRSRMAQTPVAVRPYGFWPVLVMEPADTPEIRSDRELYYDVTMTLTEHPAHLAALRGVTLGGAATPHTAPLAMSLDQAIGRAPGPSGFVASAFRVRS